MPDHHFGTTRALLLLSLFTTVEKAREIEGDLIEDEGRKGRLHYGVQVVMTSLALMCQSVRRDIVVLALLGFAGYQLAVIADGHLMWPVREYLWRGLPDDNWLVPILTYFSWSLPAFFYGFLLAFFLRIHGVGASLATAAFLLFRLSLLDVMIPWPVAILQHMVYVVLPLLLGGFLAHYIHLKRLLSRMAAGDLRAGR